MCTVPEFPSRFDLSSAQEGEEMLSLPVMKMAVLGNLWTHALPSVREFFEHAAQRKSAWEDARALEAESKVFYAATTVPIRLHMRQHLR